MHTPDTREDARDDAHEGAHEPGGCKLDLVLDARGGEEREQALGGQRVQQRGRAQLVDGELRARRRLGEDDPLAAERQAHRDRRPWQRALQEQRGDELLERHL